MKVQTGVSQLVSQNLYFSDTRIYYTLLTTSVNAKYFIFTVFRAVFLHT